MLQKGHHDVKLSAEELHRLTVWMDTASLFFGAYHDLEKQVAGELVMPQLE